MTTQTTITDRQIRGLLTEAGEHGDLVQAHVCRVALGEEDVIADADQWEERYGGGGFSDREQSQIMAVETREQARQMCARAMRSGE